MHDAIAERSNGKRKKQRKRDWAMVPPPFPDQWVPVARLAVALGETTARVYAALYDGDRPMQCSRVGRTLRVRRVDWDAYWAERQTTVARSPSRSTTAAAAHAGQGA